MFETLPKLSSQEIVPVCEILSGTNVITPDPDLQEPFTQQLTSPLTNDQLQALQAQDEKCTSLIAMLRRGRLDPLVYSIDDGILYRRVIEGGQTFQAIYVPRTPPGLIQSILKAAHDGFRRTYSAIRRLYYWKGIKEDVRQHCTSCYTCQLHRTAAVKFEAKHFKPGMRPMDFIAMDLIGEFHPPSSQGNWYALTGVCMLTGPRKVDLQDADINPMTRSAFDELCERYPTIFSRGNEDIGRTQLITMDIDMGDSPPVSSRPYTLALKHHQWVQDEIETLERAGVITKSMSPWASPIVVVPKKSQHGEPPKKRLCIDFRKINNLQQAVITEGKSKGCLSLVPLPKIDEMYAKLKGTKFFSTIDLRSGYYHIALGKDSRAKMAFVTPFGKYEFLQVPFGLAQALHASST